MTIIPGVDAVQATKGPLTARKIACSVCGRDNVFAYCALKVALCLFECYLSNGTVIT